MKHKIFACLVGLGVASCMTTRATMPKQARIGAHAAVQAADEVIGSTGGASVDAQQNLANAKTDVKSGEALLASGKYEVARLYFERAEAEAETAKIQARAKQVEDQAMRVEAAPTKKEGERGS